MGYKISLFITDKDMDRLAMASMQMELSMDDVIISALRQYTDTILDAEAAHKLTRSAIDKHDSTNKAVDLVPDPN